MWVILNPNGKRWDREMYPTREAAEKELLEFWKGTRVDFKKFLIEELPSTLDDRTDGKHDGELS